MTWRIGVLALCVAAFPAIAAAGDGEGIEQAKKVLEPLEKGYQADFDAMLAEMKEIQEGDVWKKALEAKNYDELNKLMEGLREPVQANWRKQIMAAGAPFEGTEAELVFAGMLIDQGLAENMGDLIGRMLTAHPKSAHLGTILDRAPMLARGEKKEELGALLAAVIEKNPDPEIRAQAYFARARAVDFNRDATDEEKARAAEDRAKVIEMMPEDSLMSMRARGPEFEKSNLQIGMKAPDISGVDLFGESFKLSDYRGKVVMLDFWGDW